MVDLKDQIRQLRVSGYFDAADIIERMGSQLNLRAELDYMKAFARQGDFEQELCCNQLRSLWTAFCFHADLDADTQNYTYRLLAIWGCLTDHTTAWKDFESFDRFMCEHLV